MKIIVVTPIYPADFNPKGTTHLLHYFTREWVKLGHDVVVYDISARYPKLFYLISKIFHSFLTSKLGIIVPQKPPVDKIDLNEGVKINHISIPKIIPHGRYSKKRLNIISDMLVAKIKHDNVDYIIGHWVNPTLDIIHSIKQNVDKPCCIVLHETTDQLFHYYGSKTKEMINNIDIVGFRSKALKDNFETIFGVHKCFMAYSGIPDTFIDVADNRIPKSFKEISRFIFVGTLMERKYPSEILISLKNSFKDNIFSIIYIGEGKESRRIISLSKQLKIQKNVTLIGCIPRNDIISYLEKSEVFIMISKDEVFGLVYLEAMTMGCITIASRNEGIDGIIIDGYNGFLCESGNVQELSNIITRIRQMSESQLNVVSLAARNTARLYSDKIVAKQYIDNVIKLSVS